MGCQIPDLVASQRLRDPLHFAQRIVGTPAFAPSDKLRLEIGGGLPCERRVAGAAALASGAVAFRAGTETACRVALVPEMCCGSARRQRAGRRQRERGIIGRDLGAILPVQPADDRAHRGMVATAAGIVVELAVEIAGILSRKAWR